MRVKCLLMICLLFTVTVKLEAFDLTTYLEGIIRRVNYMGIYDAKPIQNIRENYTEDSVPVEKEQKPKTPFNFSPAKNSLDAKPAQQVTALTQLLKNIFPNSEPINLKLDKQVSEIIIAEVERDMSSSNTEQLNTFLGVPRSNIDSSVCSGTYQEGICIANLLVDCNAIRNNGQVLPSACTTVFSDIQYTQYLPAVVQYQSRIDPSQENPYLQSGVLDAAKSEDKISKKDTGISSDVSGYKVPESSYSGSSNYITGIASSYHCSAGGMPQAIRDKFGCKAAFGKDASLDSYCGVALSTIIIEQMFGSIKNGKHQPLEIVYIGPAKGKKPVLTANAKKCVVATVEDTFSKSLIYHPGSNAIIDLSYCPMTILTGVKLNLVQVKFRPLRQGEQGCKINSSQV